MLRFGLVGIGDAGRHHARALSEASLQGHALCLTAVVARDRDKLLAFATDIGTPPDLSVYTSLEAMLDAKSCDAVIIATPDGLHVEHALTVIDRGLHVLVEKPLALSAQDGARVCAAALEKNVHLGVGYHLRHHPAHRLAFGLLGTHVGPLRTVSLRWAWPDPSRDGWRARGEDARTFCLAALGTHCIDLALQCGGTPSRVVGLTTPRGAIDTSAEVTFELTSGTLAHVSVSVAFRAPSRVLWSGDLGELEARGTLGARGTGTLVARTPRGEETPIPFEPSNPYLQKLVDFAARAPLGYIDDPSICANLHILDLIAPELPHAPYP